MLRRTFLKVASAIPFLGALPKEQSDGIIFLNKKSRIRHYNIITYHIIKLHCYRRRGFSFIGGNLTYFMGINFDTKEYGYAGIEGLVLMERANKKYLYYIDGIDKDLRIAKQFDYYKIKPLDLRQYQQWLSLVPSSESS